MDIYTHGTAGTWQDDTGAMHIKCDGCGEGYTFKSTYFAKQWFNRHSTGVPVRLIGLA